MPMPHRCSSNAFIEELEPRIAPAGLDLALTPPRTWIRSSSPTRTATTACDPHGQGGVGQGAPRVHPAGDIGSTEFQNANVNTQLEIVVQTPGGGNSTPAGDVDGNNFTIGGSSCRAAPAVSPGTSSGTFASRATSQARSV